MKSAHMILAAAFFASGVAPSGSEAAVTSERAFTRDFLHRRTDRLVEAAGLELRGQDAADLFRMLSVALPPADGEGPHSVHCREIRGTNLACAEILARGGPEYTCKILIAKDGRALRFEDRALEGALCPRAY